MRKTSWHAFLAGLVLWTTASLTASAEESARHALIIANKGYALQVGPLNNPHKDAETIQRALIATGFKDDNIEIVRDKSRIDILSAIERYAARLAEAGPEAIGFFYYSGHGAAKPNTDENFIIPVTVSNASTNTLWYESISLETVRHLLGDIAPRAAHILIFDACRNELRLGRNLGRGFVPTLNWGGMLIAYSTDPGEVATDGAPDAPAGPYALALSEELRAAHDLSVSQLFENVRFKVRARAGGQSPWFLHGLDRQVKFGTVEDQTTSTVEQCTEEQYRRSQAFWDEIRGTNAAHYFERLINRYPHCDHADLARGRLIELGRAQPKPDPPPQPPAIIVTSYEDKAQRLVRTFTGHSAAVGTAAFSPDGRLILSGSSDNTLKLWDVETGLEMQTFSGHSNYVTAAAFSPDGKFILSGSVDTKLKLWEIGTDHEIQTFSDHTAPVNTVAFSPDGRFAVSSTGDNNTRIWEIKKGKEIRTITKQRFLGNISFDGYFLTTYKTSTTTKNTTTHNNTISLIDINTGIIRELIDFNNDKIVGFMLFSKDSKNIITSQCDQLQYRTIKDLGDGVARRRILCNNSSVKILERSSGRELRSIAGFSGYIRSMDVSSNGYLIVVENKAIKLWNLETNREIRTFSDHTAPVNTVAFSPDGRFVVSANADNTLKLWDVSEWTQAK